MTRLNLILLPSLLILASPSWAEARAPQVKASNARPLNLSLPREALRAPDDPAIDETVQRNLSAPVMPLEPGSPLQPATLPYGSGYEHRHRDMGGAGAGAHPGAGANPGAGQGGGRRGR